MKCLKCGAETTVRDSRDSPGNTIKRRRLCEVSACAHRFTTYEIAFEGGDMEAVVRGRTTAAISVLDSLEAALADARRKMDMLDSLFKPKDGRAG